jgi:tetratricopeptide (TPR) repeat protein
VLQDWLTLLQANPAPPVLDRYLLLALTCGRAAGTPPDDPSFADRPLLQYRLGLCGFQQREHLDTVFAASPRFAETGFYLARYEMTNAAGARVLVTRALPLLLAAHESVPSSPIITTTLATVWSSRNEFARALALYDDALAIRPAQRDALLGRARMLTYLGRSDDAIVTATRLIDLGTWYLGDAYYWRAWNRYATGNIAGAAADVVDARRYQSSGELLTLSGMIAYDQQRPADARRDFDEALRVNPVNCPAMWYLGLIDVDARNWQPGRDTFVNAAGCYTSAVAAIETEDLPADLSPEALQQQQEDRARRLADNQRQVARSALNAALLSMQIGDRDTALRFAGIASTHELTKERAASVLSRAAER